MRIFIKILPLWLCFCEQSGGMTKIALAAVTTEFVQFYEFETLTLFPIDKNLMEIMLLNEEESEWVDDYHRKVFESLAPHLTIEELVWLKDKCSPIYELTH